MATDYDAPRKSDDEESLEAIKEGAPAKAVDISDEGDHSEAFVMPEVSVEEDDVVLIPIQPEMFDHVPLPVLVPLTAIFASGCLMLLVEIAAIVVTIKQYKKEKADELRRNSEKD